MAAWGLDVHLAVAAVVCGHQGRAGDAPDEWIGGDADAAGHSICTFIGARRGLTC
jgi:hypothetical protein